MKCLSVDINEKNESLNQKVIPEVKSIQTRSTIGPNNHSKKYFIKKSNVPKKLKEANALLFIPAIYNGLSYIKALEEIENQNIKIHFISGHGLSLIIASLYAKGIKVDLIDWKFHKLLSQFNKQYPYSQKWKIVLKEFIKDEFSGHKIEDSKINLLIPYKGKFIRRGLLAEALIKSIGLDKNGILTSIGNRVYDYGLIKSFGADKTFVISALQENAHWGATSGNLIGIFGKIYSMAKKEEDQSDLFFNFNLGPLSIDNPKNVTNVLKASMDQTEILSTSILKKINIDNE